MRRPLLVLSLTLSAACSGGVGAVGCSVPGLSISGPDFTTSDTARRFDLRGRVIAVEKAERRATVAHERIDGFMDPMTMPFTVKERWALDAMKPGDLVQGTLVVDGSRSWIEVAAVTGDPRGAPAPGEPKGTWAPAEPGTPVPALKLVDQDRRTFGFDRYKGAPLLVTFAYTRCPLPEYCPLVMQRFAAIEKATAADPRLSRVRLLTVTLDPEHRRGRRRGHRRGRGGARSVCALVAGDRKARRDQAARRLLRARLLRRGVHPGDSFAADRRHRRRR
jgi:protein SCO1/2